MDRIIVERDVRVPMRDGCELGADLYRPAGAERCPVLLQRTPYNRQMAPAAEMIRMAAAGFAVVVQDVRGRYGSQGTFSPFVSEAHDGSDSVNWLNGQPWSDGRVGMFGSSYVGATQWLAASCRPPGLRAIAPAVTSSNYHEGWTYQGGALQLGFILTWGRTHLGLGDAVTAARRGEAEAAEVARLMAEADEVEVAFQSRPLTDAASWGGWAPYMREWVARPRYEDWWRSLAPDERYEEITVPSFNIGGWHDIFLAGTLHNYRGMRDRGGSPTARRPHLLVGPWAHANMTGEFAEKRYGLGASALVADIVGRQIRWFDHYLRGVENGVEHDRPVRLFVLGVDEWRDLDDWPPPGVEHVRWYLHSGGSANTLSGDGRLSTTEPDDEPSDSYRHDPLRPVPTVGGRTFLPGLSVSANAGPRDQRAVEMRDDVLCFTSCVLERHLEVIGEVSLVLFAQSTARDTDFTGKLIDVHPDGRAEIVTDGILRARYRHGLSGPVPLEPKQVYELHVDLGATAVVLRAGHRLRLEIASSSFPRFDVNFGTGGDAADDGITDAVTAVNTIHHAKLRPSHLLLPIAG
jgi:putative CocE/NonD family hydrolase